MAQGEELRPYWWEEVIDLNLDEDCPTEPKRQKVAAAVECVAVVAEASTVAEATTGPQSDSSDSIESNDSLLLPTYGFGDPSNAIPKFPEISFPEPSSETLPRDWLYEAADRLKSLYKGHLQEFLDLIMCLDCKSFETLWREFWRNNLSEGKLFTLYSLQPVQNFIKTVDLMFYQNLIQVLVPDLLKPLPATQIQFLSSIAENMDKWMEDAMEAVPRPMVRIKLDTVHAFTSGLQDRTSLNHLMQASKAILQNRIKTTRMLFDLNTVGSERIRRQVATLFGDDDIIPRFESELRLNLQHQSTLKQWIKWLEIFSKGALSPYEGLPTYATEARILMKKLSFFSSRIIKDLSCRAAESFKSFQMIRLLLDEYMTYLIKQRIAEATGVPPISVTLEDVGGHYGRIKLRVPWVIAERKPHDNRMVPHGNGVPKSPPITFIQAGCLPNGQKLMDFQEREPHAIKDLHLASRLNHLGNCFSQLECFDESITSSKPEFWLNTCVFQRNFPTILSLPLI